eukprot:TRINITY_DN9947_c0_g1_i1.p1 TRINITY_DN9947_c0_g1~~TRINITY_DN9947_c0_g1_i1.p1  ORF type:complete len:1712 (+),score=335.46 TRINITY_DN9947_c0_g1_i1:22-5136(+)
MGAGAAKRQQPEAQPGAQPGAQPEAQPGAPAEDPFVPWSGAGSSNVPPRLARVSDHSKNSSEAESSVASTPADSIQDHPLPFRERPSRSSKADPTHRFSRTVGTTSSVSQLFTPSASGSSRGSSAQGLSTRTSTRGSMRSRREKRSEQDRERIATLMAEVLAARRANEQLRDQHRQDVTEMEDTIRRLRASCRPLTRCQSSGLLSKARGGGHAAGGEEWMYCLPDNSWEDQLSFSLRPGEYKECQKVGSPTAEEPPRIEPGHQVSPITTHASFSKKAQAPRVESDVPPAGMSVQRRVAGSAKKLQSSTLVQALAEQSEWGDAAPEPVTFVDAATHTSVEVSSDPHGLMLRFTPDESKRAVRRVVDSGSNTLRLPEWRSAKSPEGAVLTLPQDQPALLERVKALAAHAGAAFTNNNSLAIEPPQHRHKSAVWRRTSGRSTDRRSADSSRAGLEFSETDSDASEAERRCELRQRRLEELEQRLARRASDAREVQEKMAALVKTLAQTAATAVPQVEQSASVRALEAELSAARHEADGLREQNNILREAGRRTRVDPGDGRRYQVSDFLSFYGGLEEWRAAADSEQGASEARSNTADLLARTVAAERAVEQERLDARASLVAANQRTLQSRSESEYCRRLLEQQHASLKLVMEAHSGAVGSQKVALEYLVSGAASPTGDKLRQLADRLQEALDRMAAAATSVMQFNHIRPPPPPPSDSASVNLIEAADAAAARRLDELEAIQGQHKEILATVTESFSTRSTLEAGIKSAFRRSQMRRAWRLCAAPPPRGCSQEELRVDVTDGLAYSRQDYLLAYGGEEEWLASDAALPAALIVRAAVALLSHRARSATRRSAADLEQHLRHRYWLSWRHATAGRKTAVASSGNAAAARCRSVLLTVSARWAAAHAAFSRWRRFVCRRRKADSSGAAASLRHTASRFAALARFRAAAASRKALASVCVDSALLHSITPTAETDLRRELAKTAADAAASIEAAEERAKAESRSRDKRLSGIVTMLSIRCAVAADATRAAERVCERTAAERTAAEDALARAGAERQSEVGRLQQQLRQLGEKLEVAENACGAERKAAEDAQADQRAEVDRLRQQLEQLGERLAAAESATAAERKAAEKAMLHAEAQHRIEVSQLMQQQVSGSRSSSTLGSRSPRLPRSAQSSPALPTSRLSRSGPSILELLTISSKLPPRSSRKSTASGRTVVLPLSVRLSAKVDSSASPQIQPKPAPLEELQCTSLLPTPREPALQVLITSSRSPRAAGTAVALQERRTLSASPKAETRAVGTEALPLKEAVELVPATFSTQSPRPAEGGGGRASPVRTSDCQSPTTAVRDAATDAATVELTVSQSSRQIKSPRPSLRLAQTLSLSPKVGKSIHDATTETAAPVLAVSSTCCQSPRAEARDAATGTPAARLVACHTSSLSPRADGAALVRKETSTLSPWAGQSVRDAATVPSVPKLVLTLSGCLSRKEETADACTATTPAHLAEGGSQTWTPDCHDAATVTSATVLVASHSSSQAPIAAALDRPGPKLLTVAVTDTQSPRVHGGGPRPPLLPKHSASATPMDSSTVALRRRADVLEARLADLCKFGRWARCELEAWMSGGRVAPPRTSVMPTRHGQQQNEAMRAALHAAAAELEMWRSDEDSVRSSRAKRAVRTARWSNEVERCSAADTHSPLTTAAYTPAPPPFVRPASASPGTRSFL